jgi:histidine triad (HIT) family protein
MECLFCKIIEKEINSYIINENDDFIAILDISQATKGHTLVLPKKHFENFLDPNIYNLDSKGYQEFIYDTVNLINKKLKPNGFNFLSNCQAAAGQTVFHLHTHIIPRYDNDTVNISLPFEPKDEDYMKAVFNKINS